MSDLTDMLDLLARRINRLTMLARRPRLKKSLTVREAAMGWQKPGQASSPQRIEASRANGRLGGRPRKPDDELSRSGKSKRKARAREKGELN